jgi:iron-sulfur cluster assembly protein
LHDSIAARRNLRPKEAQGHQTIGYNGFYGIAEEQEDRMIQITEKAVGKVKEIMGSQDPAPAGLRIAVVGGGCSGFSYSMAFENQPNMLDKTYNYDGLKIFVDQASLLYLDGAEVDYVETLEGSGFKFNNPHVKSTCGCGSSFQV